MGNGGRNSVPPTRPQMGESRRCTSLYEGLLRALPNALKPGGMEERYISLLSDTRACDGVGRDLSAFRRDLAERVDACVADSESIETRELCGRRVLVEHRWRVQWELLRGMPWQRRLSWVADAHPLAVLAGTAGVALALWRRRAPSTGC